MKEIGLSSMDYFFQKYCFRVRMILGVGIRHDRQVEFSADQFKVISYLSFLHEFIWQN